MLASRVKWIMNYIFLPLRAIDWYINDSIMRGAGGVREFWGGAPEFYRAIITKCVIYFWIPQLEPIRLAPLLGDLIKGGGLSAWSQKCMECPQGGRMGVFRQNNSN